ncbi:hypothetical protein ILYODFUR_029756 [Ilyodon furcidens]|uniref:Uncharacterized protein n=1 Tax=Ilyodon furcidens TaxID=33524 RepID=A0ABV0ULN1_9TELE
MGLKCLYHSVELCSVKLYKTSVTAKQEVPALEARPSLSPKQGLTLLYLCGEACGLAGSAQPGSQLSPPSQLPTPESQAEQSRGPPETLERVTARGGGEYMARSQPIVYTYSHSVTTSHTPPPALLVHLLYSN